MRTKKIRIVRICPHAIINSVLDSRGIPDYQDWSCRISRCNLRSDLKVFCVIRDAILSRENSDSQNGGKCENNPGGRA